jgi:hypothetical protein
MNMSKSKKKARTNFHLTLNVPFSSKNPEGLKHLLVIAQRHCENLQADLKTKGFKVAPPSTEVSSWQE